MSTAIVKTYNREEEIETNFKAAGFGKSYQIKVVHAILEDNDFASQLTEVLDTDFFDQKCLRVITDTYFNHFKKYDAFPSKKMLLQIISKDLLESEDEIIKEQITEFFKKIKAEPLGGDEKYIKESALEFCKMQALKGALFESVDLIHNAKYDQISGLIKHALELGQPRNFGHDYINDVEIRHAEGNVRRTIPTGWDVLDAKEILGGGLARGELGTVLGIAGSGKSMFLVHLGAKALERGYNVLHYTFELSETNIGIRYDACLTGVSQNDAYNLKAAIDQVLPTITNGSLYIKAYPTKGATIQTIKNHMKLLEVKEFTPDIIIVDYADIMKSTKGFEAKRFEQESIYEELRAMAQEYNVAVWTASQTNRSAVGADIIDLDTIGECWAKVQIADIVLTFSRKREDKLKKSGKVYVAKNRIGFDGSVFASRIDTECVDIRLLSMSEDEEEEILGEDKEAVMKRSLRERLEVFKRERKAE